MEFMGEEAGTFQQTALRPAEKTRKTTVVTQMGIQIQYLLNARQVY
jgi:hypothetical protein